MMRGSGSAKTAMASTRSGPSRTCGGTSPARGAPAALGADERPERRPAGKAGRFRVDQGKAREARVADEHVPSLAAGAPGGRERLEQRGLQALAHGTGPRPNPPPCIHIRKTLPR